MRSGNEPMFLLQRIRMKLDSPINTIAGVGPKVAEKLSRLSIKTAEDLIWHLPHRYEDFSNIKEIRELVPEEKATVIARILGIGSRRAWRRRMMITEAIIEDQTGAMRAVWFNQPFIEEMLKKDLWVSFSGKVSVDNNGPVFSNPAYETIGSTLVEKDMTHTGALVPIYPETRGLTSRWLRYRIKGFLSQIEHFEDFLPASILKKYGLLILDEALRKIHFPSTQADAKAAERRLSFGELFLLQLFGALERRKIRAKTAPLIKTDMKAIKEF